MGIKILTNYFLQAIVFDVIHNEVKIYKFNKESLRSSHSSSFLLQFCGSVSDAFSSRDFFILLRITNYSMSALLAEFIGTAILILLGNGVVANVLLKDTKGHDSGLIVIAFGWAIAVFIGVFITASISGAHLNPAVTLGLAITGDFAWSLVPGYMIAQLLGAMLGTSFVWMMYRPHYEATQNAGDIQATFCNAPAIPNTLTNFLSELLGTFVLVYGVLHIAGASVGTEPASLGALDALPVALIVLGVGLSLGGTTGYAINPARDLGPRIMHAILPITHKGDNGWGYSWIPVMGPFAGGAIAAVLMNTVG